MKFRTALFIVGGAILVGAVGYGIYKYLLANGYRPAEIDRSPDDEGFEGAPKQEDPISEAQTEFEHATVISESTQQNAATVIRNTHQDAAEEMRKIFDDMQEDSAQFEETHKRLDEELNELLK